VLLLVAAVHASPLVPNALNQDWLFITDLFLNFLTCYEVKGQLIENRWMIAKNYFSSWFTIDFLSSFPIDLVVGTSPSTGSGSPVDAAAAKAQATQLRSAKLGRMARIMKVMRLLRLLRAAKMGRILRKYEMMFNIHHGVVTCVKFCFGFLFVAHWLGCFFFIFPQLGDFDQSSWVISYWFGSESNQTLVDKGWDYANYPYDAFDTMVQGTEVKDEMARMGVTSTKQYITALYWAVTTVSTIGYGDISPGARNTTEKVFCIIVELVGAAIFAFGVTTVTSIIDNLDMQSVLYQKKVDELDQYMDYRECDRALKIRVRKFVLFRRESQTACFFFEDNVLANLSPKLKEEVIYHAFGACHDDTDCWCGLHHTAQELKLPLYRAGIFRKVKMFLPKSERHPGQYPDSQNAGVDGVTVAAQTRGFSDLGPAFLTYILDNMSSCLEVSTARRGAEVDGCTGRRASERAVKAKVRGLTASLRAACVLRTHLLLTYCCTCTRLHAH
jgi:hypothetical protein